MSFLQRKLPHPWHAGKSAKIKHLLLIWNLPAENLFLISRTTSIQIFKGLILCSYHVSFNERSYERSYGVRPFPLKTGLQYIRPAIDSLTSGLILVNAQSSLTISKLGHCSEVGDNSQIFGLASALNRPECCFTKQLYWRLFLAVYTIVFSMQGLCHYINLECPI